MPRENATHRSVAPGRRQRWLWGFRRELPRSLSPQNIGVRWAFAHDFHRGSVVLISALSHVLRYPPLAQHSMSYLKAVKANQGEGEPTRADPSDRTGGRWHCHNVCRPQGGLASHWALSILPASFPRRGRRAETDLGSQAIDRRSCFVTISCRGWRERDPANPLQGGS